MKISDVLLPEYDQEMAHTRRTLERVPDGKWDWRPHAKSSSMGQLATHLMNIPAWMNDALEKDFFDFAPVGGEPYKSPTASSTKEVIEKFDKAAAAGRAALAKAGDEEFMKPWSLMQGGQTLLTMPKSVVVRNFVLNHNVHHRAQLGVYLRLNDIPVPAIYGPSADEA